MTITTRKLRRGDVVLTWSTWEDSPIRHRAITDRPGAYPVLRWLTVAHTVPAVHSRPAALFVHFTDGSAAKVPATAGWIDGREQDPEDECFRRDGTPYPRGRCDTCGAPCDDEMGECTTDPAHPVSVEA